jgi:hypothetical protein
MLMVKLPHPIMALAMVQFAVFVCCAGIKMRETLTVVELLGNFFDLMESPRHQLALSIGGDRHPCWQWAGEQRQNPLPPWQRLSEC